MQLMTGVILLSKERPGATRIEYKQGMIPSCLIRVTMTMPTSDSRPLSTLYCWMKETCPVHMLHMHTQSLHAG